MQLFKQKYTCWTFSAIAFSLYIFIYSGIGHADDPWRPFVVGDIVGRSLDVPGLGWIGHVGLGYGDNVGKPTQKIVEVLNEKTVIQFNAFSDFISRSKYWGSRHGFGDYAGATKKVIMEAFQQSFWCPKYRKITLFEVGEGYIDKNGEHIPTKCAEFRCDTFIAWLFENAGYPEIINNNIMLPRAVWYTFPSSNGDSPLQLGSGIQAPMLSDQDKKFDALTAQELNNLSYQKFTEVVVFKKSEGTPSHCATLWKFAKNKDVHPAKREAILEMLVYCEEPDIIPKLIEMFKIEENEEVRAALISETMSYYQNNWAQVKSSGDYETLKTFYYDMLKKNLPERASSYVLRGYLDFHSGYEIANDEVFLSTYEKHLKNMEQTLALGLYYELASKSPEFEKIALNSMIKMLHQYQRSDLDAMFFGLINRSYKHYKNPESINLIKNYMNSVKNKYQNNLNTNIHDAYFDIAKTEFNKLNDYMNKN